MLHGMDAIVAHKSCAAASKELSEERTSAQASASEGGSDLGISKTSHARAEMSLGQELHSRQSQSGDLVEVIFGSLVDTVDGANALAEFLSMGLISVHRPDDTKCLPHTEWQKACAHAALQSKHAIKPAQPAPSDSYHWKWALDVRATESTACLFLNVVVIAAYAAAIRLGKAHTTPVLRFVTLPDPNRPVPLSSDTGAQDCRPDVLAFELSSFRRAPTADTDSTILWPLVDNPFTYIQDKFPRVLSFTAIHKAQHPSAISEFNEWFREQATCDHLDLLRFCWPEVQLTLEAKINDKYNALLQALVYMRQQRHTQPWMRSILGLFVTTTEMGILRADSLGVEHCVFSRTSSRGVLDTIRVCFGLVTSNKEHRGQHESFELGETQSVAPPHVKGGSLKKKKDDDGDVFMSKLELSYSHRTVRFIRLHGDKIYHTPDGTTPDALFYVHYLIQNTSSLIGRGARIFCVSREVADGNLRSRFIGTYALKMYYADYRSDCYKHDLIDRARQGQARKICSRLGNGDTAMRCRSAGSVMKLCAAMQKASPVSLTFNRTGRRCSLNRT
ncbi:hypothetical protein B0H17DRAFT_177711 [Mycena rosella]|uniref:Uncharacterized protein n=1 Tax=Mycena rosella TaxID=1033263 RepID=A0AAD7D0T5_MYCRO|nr:hypothetical protein B0H17DRAFT_177711 [Mycena rosella]